MSIFICTTCGVIENTAVSDYWIAQLEGRLPECSLCSRGIWHNHFERKHWSYYGVSEVLRGQKEGQGNFINAKEHLTSIGVIGSKKPIYEEKLIDNDTMLRKDKY